MSKASRKSKTDGGIKAWLPSPPEEKPDEPGDTNLRDDSGPDEGDFDSPGEKGAVDSPGEKAEVADHEVAEREEAGVGDGGKPVLVEPGRRFVAFLLEAVLFIGTFAVGWLVWSMIEWRHGRTPAKRLLRDLAVVDAWSGERVSWQRMALRELGAKIGLVGLFGVATFGLGWAIAAVLVLSETRASLWDRLAGTTVVHPDR